MNDLKNKNKRKKKEVESVDPKQRKSLKVKADSKITRNYKSIIPHTNGGRHSKRKTVTNKRLTSGRLKPKQHSEGLFLKGLRSQYVKRDVASNANDARRNEDINKIIDLGNVIKTIKTADSKGYRYPGAKNEKNFETELRCSIFEIENEDSVFRDSEDFCECNLSPISFPKCSSSDSDSGPAIISTDLNTTATKTQSNNNKFIFSMDFNDDFIRFALDVESRADIEILSQLPSDVAVLETAMESLRNLYLSRVTTDDSDNTEDDEGRKDFMKGCLTSALSQCCMWRDQYESGYELIVNNISRSFVNPFVGQMAATGKNYSHGLREIAPFVNPRAVEDHLGILSTGFGIINSSVYPLNVSYSFTSENDNERQYADDGMKETKELDFNTPPIQFYRRNMF